MADLTRSTGSCRPSAQDGFVTVQSGISICAGSTSTCASTAPTFRCTLTPTGTRPSALRMRTASPRVWACSGAASPIRSPVWRSMLADGRLLQIGASRMLRRGAGAIAAGPARPAQPVLRRRGRRRAGHRAGSRPGARPVGGAHGRWDLPADRFAIRRSRPRRTGGAGAASRRFAGRGPAAGSSRSPSASRVGPGELHARVAAVRGHPTRPAPRVEVATEAERAGVPPTTTAAGPGHPARRGAPPPRTLRGHRRLRPLRAGARGLRWAREVDVGAQGTRIAAYFGRRRGQPRCALHLRGRRRARAPGARPSSQAWCSSPGSTPYPTGRVWSGWAGCAAVRSDHPGALRAVAGARSVRHAAGHRAARPRQGAPWAGPVTTVRARRPGRGRRPAGSSLAGLVKRYAPGAASCSSSASTSPATTSARASSPTSTGSSTTWARTTRWRVPDSSPSTAARSSGGTTGALVGRVPRLRRCPGYGTRRGYQTGHTWHVRRDVYDALLLEHARSSGRGDDGVLGGDASSTRRRAQAVTSATAASFAPGSWSMPRGQRTEVARRAGTLTFDPELQNVAVYAYFEGARLDPALSGTWEKSRIAVVSTNVGWIWYIPLAPGFLSVGVVTSRDVLAKRAAGVDRRLLRRPVRSCPEVRAILRGRRHECATPARTPTCCSSATTATRSRLHGPGWALCGDAAGFVDPILSIGCYLAHAAASHLAYCCARCCRGRGRRGARLPRLRGAGPVRACGAFRRMTYMFYGFNESKESWWWEARAHPQRARPACFREGQARLPGARHRLRDQPSGLSGGHRRFGVTSSRTSTGTWSRPKGSSPTTVRRAAVCTGARSRSVPSHGSSRWRGLDACERSQRVTFPDAPGDDASVRAPALAVTLLALPARSRREAPRRRARQLTPEESSTVVPQLSPLLRGLVDMGVLATG